MLSFLNSIGKSFLDLVYPPLCLHCEEGLEKAHPLFCFECLKQMAPIDPAERCPYCFSSEIDLEHEKCCDQCRHQPPLTERIAAVFDYEGPAATLIKKLKYGGQSYLAKGAGAYLAAYFLQLGWPLPNGIIPMPMSRLRAIERGYNQSALLAESIASLLSCPIYDLLKRTAGDYSQAGLNYQQRLELNSKTFQVKSKISLEDKCLLIIDDVITTGSSIRCCAEALQELYPSKIYALAVCRAR